MNYFLMLNYKTWSYFYIYFLYIYKKHHPFFQVFFQLYTLLGFFLPKTNRKLHSCEFLTAVIFLLVAYFKDLRTKVDVQASRLYPVSCLTVAVTLEGG